MHHTLSHRSYQSPIAHRPSLPARTRSAQDGPLRRWLRAATRGWRRRKMIATLSAMDDWVLRDIGIRRDEIESLVDSFDAYELRMRPLARSSPQSAGGAEHSSDDLLRRKVA